MEEDKTIILESKIHALEELLSVSESSFLEEARKLEDANKQLRDKIIEHERLERKLHDSEEEYRTLFESSRDAIMLLGPDGFFDCNKTTLDLFNFSIKEQFIAKHPSNLSPPSQPDGRDSLTAAMEHIETAYRDGTDFFEWVHTRKDGTPFYAEVLLSRMEYQSKMVLQATVRDITERKNAEQELIKAHKVAEENAQQRGRIEMSNNMLHDIGNAMTGITAHALLPQRDKDWQELKALRQLCDMFVGKEKEFTAVLGDEKEKALINFMETLLSSLQKRNTVYGDFFKKILSTAGHINAVLDLQRYYVLNKGTLLSTAVDLKTIIEDTLVMLSGSIQKRNMQVKLNSIEKIPAAAGDRTRLIRVFMNIVKNIYEAFDEVEAIENRKLEISISPDIENGEIKIMFLDNAAGFASEIAEKLFERGFTTKQNGSGIGLHECRSIIESHGGTITIQSNGKNTGALTIVRLPIPAIKKG
jgi:PAS domain S-box-containing protein